MSLIKGSIVFGRGTFDAIATSKERSMVPLFIPCIAIVDPCILPDCCRQSSSHKILEDDYCYTFLDINPVSQFHTLIIPKKHHRDMFNVTPEVACHMMGYDRKIGESIC